MWGGGAGADFNHARAAGRRGHGPAPSRGDGDNIMLLLYFYQSHAELSQRSKIFQSYYVYLKIVIKIIIINNKEPAHDGCLICTVALELI